MIVAKVYYLQVPMRRAFAHAQTRRDVAESLIFTLDYQGICGIGECIPRPYVTGETIQSVLEVFQHFDLKEIMAQIVKTKPNHAQACIHRLNSVNYFNPVATNNAICLLEMAILDWLGKKLALSLHQLLPLDALSQRRPEDCQPIRISQVLDLSLSVEDFLKDRGPFHHIKIKLDEQIEKNIVKVKQVRQFVGQHVPITIDANMGWDMAMAIAHVSALQQYHINYYEEPLGKKQFADYQLLRLQYGAKILLDESLCSLVDAEQAIAWQAADAFNIRLAKCGGLWRSLAIIQLAERSDISYQLGTQVAELGPIIAAERQLASILNNYFTYEAGQHDYYFENYIITPMPVIDRQKNIAPILSGSGLTVTLNENFQHYSKPRLTWDDHRWLAL